VQPNRRPGRLSIHYAGGDADGILFNRHSPAGAISFLASLHILIKISRRQSQAGRHTFQDGSQRWAMGLARSQES
jgi:hypothetical protein